MAEEAKVKRHLFFSNSSTSSPFTAPSSPREEAIFPNRSRINHSAKLANQLNLIRQESKASVQERQDLGLEPGIGIRVQFEGAKSVELPFASLARDNQHIELLNVKKSQDKIYATVFVPEGKLSHFENVISQYRNEDTKSGKAKNLKLVSSIEQIREATFSELWTDDESVLPNDDAEIVNWEVWLPVRSNRLTVIDKFREQAQLLGLEVAEDYLEFPERSIIIAKGTLQQITQSARLLDMIAEVRRLKETSEFFVEMNNQDQRAFADELLDRLTFLEGESPYVSILDTGVNNGHVLLAPVLHDIDLHTVEPTWGKDDSDGHGTGMAGLATYGDLTGLLESDENISITHRLESVKILRADGDNEEKHHGNTISEAIARIEVSHPNRSRIVCMAVTSLDNRDRGRPSAWSAAVDNLASGGKDETKRLLIISAGNVHSKNWSEYPNGNLTDGIHDPGQAWNALTVGAFTEKDRIEAGWEQYEPVATAGYISPHSTTSTVWNNSWPLKPDVVFEGGNIAKDEHGCVTMGSLELTSTFHKPQERQFDHFNATSAATALAAQFAAKISAEYPALLQETIRGLMVHSARWTDEMTNIHLPPAPNTSHFERLIRVCGFGTPTYERALWSLKNSLTMIAEDEIQPFWKDQGRYKTKDMNLYSLPWPQDTLLGLGETEVTMRVTLSYFIEPNPSERGFVGRYRYASHGLRFDMRRTDETQEAFQERINSAARDEESGTQFGGDGGGWLLGKQKRHKGSLHSDIWIGTAAELANRQNIAVYPTIGWWRERPHLHKFEKRARYALLISIECPEVNTDLYAEVEARLEIPVEIEI